MTLEQILADIRSDCVKNIFLDTDTYNEMDDQYAVAHAIGAERIRILGFGAAPFHNDRSESFRDGMEKSYDEIGRVLSVLGKENDYPYYKGSDSRIGDTTDFTPIDSPAARAIIDLAHGNTTEILYVLATGAITNVVSAILLDPSIKEKICVIWLGLNTLERGSAKEFNFLQDSCASRILLNSGVPLVILPALGNPGYGTQELVVTMEDLKKINASPAVKKFFAEALPMEFGAEREGWKRVIWDIAAPGVLQVPEAYTLKIIPSPIVTDENKIIIDSTRHKVIYMEKLDRDAVVNDCIRCISKF